MHDHLFPSQSFFHGGRLQMHWANERPGLNVGYTQVPVFRKDGDAVSVLGNVQRHTQSSLHINQYLDSMGQANPLK